MKIFTTSQISKIDKYTIENEPISSIDLMERASNQISDYLIRHFSKEHSFCFVCGFGNNGGDGLAVARILFLKGYKVRVLLFAEKEKQSPDNQINHQRCLELGIELFQSTNADDFLFNQNEIIVDALFGSGLNRPLEGNVVQIIKKINQSKNTVISIDIPSGLMGEDNRQNKPDNIINAKLTLTLEFPKLAFFFPENERFVGTFKVIPIYLHEEIKKSEPSPYFFIEKSLVATILKKRSKFAEKRAFGHGLLYAGNTGKMGAAILASKAAMRSGAGLVSVLIPKELSPIIHTTVPEVLIKEITPSNNFSHNEYKYFNALAIGPAIGIDDNSLFLLKSFILETKIPLILDADAITILAQNKNLLNQLPENTIITPHLREFDRLFGEHSDHFSRFLTARKMAKELKIIIILKGAYSQIHLPNGDTYFNSTGNPGMATGGSGDVLTGILLGLLAQNYTPSEAAIIGTYIHGLAGDLALNTQSHESLIASDIVEHLGKAFQTIHKFD
ncbi:MAG: NAD(P)H-hydrate dehydratase [Bacteroidales bacterium]